MTVAQIALLSLKLSAMLTAFALGLRTTPSDWTWLLRRPGLLGRSLLAINVLMPLFALGAIRLMHLRFPVVVALLAISLSPVPPFLPGKQEKAGGTAVYAIDLLAIASALSVIWIPLAIELDERVLGIPLEVSPWTVAEIVAQIVLIPLIVGTIIGVFARARADRIAPMLAKAARVVLAAAVLLILLKLWRAALGLIGDGTLAAFIGFVVVGLTIGHLLGGPDERGSHRARPRVGLAPPRHRRHDRAPQLSRRTRRASCAPAVSGGERPALVALRPLAQTWDRSLAVNRRAASGGSEACTPSVLPGDPDQAEVVVGSR